MSLQLAGHFFIHISPGFSKIRGYFFILLLNNFSHHWRVNHQSPVRLNQYLKTLLMEIPAS